MEFDEDHLQQTKEERRLFEHTVAELVVTVFQNVDDLWVLRSSITALPGLQVPSVLHLQLFGISLRDFLKSSDAARAFALHLFRRFFSRLGERFCSIQVRDWVQQIRKDVFRFFASFYASGKWIFENSRDPFKSRFIKLKSFFEGLAIVSQVQPLKSNPTPPLNGKRIHFELR